MDFILFTIALLLLLTAGLGTALLLGPRHRDWSMIELLSLTPLLGAACISLASFSLGWVFSGDALRLATSLACLAVGAAGLMLKEQSVQTNAWSCPMSTWQSLVLGLLAIQIGFILWLCGSQPLGWDGLLVWELKARLIWMSDGGIPTSYLSDPTRVWSHPQYPLLLPLTEAWFYNWLGRADQGWVKLIFPCFYLAAVGLLCVGGTRLGGEWWQGATTALLMFYVPLVVVGGGSASSGYADFPLAVYYLAAVIYLLEYWQTETLDALRLVAGMSAMLVWVKQEGVVLWLCLVCLMVVKSVRLTARQTVTALGLIIVPGVLVFSGWKLFLYLVGALASKDFLPLTPHTLWVNLGRSAEIGQAVLQELVDWSHWRGLWAGLLFAAIFPPVRQYGCWPRGLLVLVTLPITVYIGAYFFSAWSPVRIHIASSFSRLLLQVSLVAVLLLGLTISTLVKRWLFRCSNRSVNL